jgi:hypothetical protein
METSKQKKSIDNLYNCDRKSTSSLNLFPTGFYDSDWLSADDGSMGYWVGENATVALDCNAKGELMLDELYSGTDDRSIYGAYLIRLIKK